MANYYIGKICFGQFAIDYENAPTDFSPLALIQYVQEIRDFEKEEDAFDYAEENGLDYIAVEGATDEHDNPYEIAFTQKNYYDEYFS